MAICAVLLCASCKDDLRMPDGEETGLAAGNGYVTVMVRCGEGNEQSTRAGETEEGVEDLHENLIRSVTLCLWPNGGDYTEESSSVMIYSFEDLDKENEVILRVPLTEGLLGLFNMDSSNTCHVFAAVNVDCTGLKSVAEIRGKVLEASFADTKVQPSFVMDGDATVELFGNVLDNSLSASGEINVKRLAAKMDLHLEVEESVTETTDGTETVWTPDKENIKVFLRNGVMRSSLNFRSVPTVPAGDYYSTDYHTEEPYMISVAASGDAAHDEAYPLEQEIPFYSYPNSWETSASGGEKTGEESYIVLSIPWTKDGGETSRTCYYRVPVVPENLEELVRNTAYHVFLHVSVLGSGIPEEPEPVMELSYQAADWSQENLDVNIKDVRYLVVDQNDYVVNNQDAISIPFSTSHPTEVQKASMTFYRYNFSDEGNEEALTIKLKDAQNINSLNTKGKSAKVFDAQFDNETDHLNVSHTLNVWKPMRKENGKNVEVSLTQGEETRKKTDPAREKVLTAKQIKDIKALIEFYRETDVAEYSRIEYSVTVRHIDDHNFTETVTITQYPGMYITAVQNYFPSTPNSNGVYETTGGGKLGSTWINNSYVYNNLEWNTSIGISTSYRNWNPNMYLVTVTTLPADSKYRIADPRARFRNNNLANTTMDKATSNSTYKNPWATFAQATPFGGGDKRTLEWYYPTVEANYAKVYIAPKFRMCSSWGGTGKCLNRQEARRRCASYQEMGYPAGRWRLPTFGEVSFMNELARQFKIPFLFGDATTFQYWYYWCAQGLMQVPPKFTNEEPDIPKKYHSNTEGYTEGTTITDSDDWRARFVYDEWYWGTKTISIRDAEPHYPFRWGDAERNITGIQ